MASNRTGCQMDPVAADGMLFYKGFFLVLLGIRSQIVAATTAGSSRSR